MKTKLFILAFAMFSSINLYSQLADIHIDIIEHDGIEIPSLAGQTTYRIFAQLENPTDWVTEIFGNDVCPLEVTTTTSFFRSPIHNGPLLSSIAVPDWGVFFPDLVYSSGLTISLLAQNTIGVPFSVNESGSIQDQSETTVNSFESNSAPWMQTFENGGDIIINTLEGGAVFNLYSGNIQAVGAEHFVLLGQFTTDGEFSFNLNLTVITPLFDGGNILNTYTWCDGTIPSLSYTGINCTSPEACNYNPDATEDDGSCFFIGDACDDGNAATDNDVITDEDCTCQGSLLGCTIETACNYNADAEVNDNSCLFTADGCDDGNLTTYNDQISATCQCSGVPGGCMDATACNFDEEITVDDGSCVYPTDECDDENEFTLDDQYQPDCECAGEFEGCNDPVALNFDPSSAEPCNGDNSCCIYIPANDLLENATELTIAAPSSCIPVLENTTYATDSPESSTESADVWYEFTSASGCVIIFAESADFDLELSLFSNSLELLVGENVGTNGLELIQYSVDIDQPYFINISGSNLLEFGWFTLCLEEPTLYGGLAVGCLISSCTDVNACNFDPEATEDNGTCYYQDQLCNDYDPTTINDTVQPDCTCSGDKLGCTDSNACNYIDHAVIDDGSCRYSGTSCNDENAQTLYDVITENCTCEGLFFEDIPGCMDSSACNYNAAATESDGSCFFTNDACDDGNEFTINDIYLSDCTCAGILEGCNDPEALNFDSTSDGPCNGTNSCCVYAPANDELENSAILEIFQNGNCSPTDGTTSYGNDSPESFPLAPDVWYNFTADFECINILAESDEFNLILSVYDENMNLIEEQNSTNNGSELIQVGVTLGVNYTVNVSSTNNITDGGFTICVQESAVSDAVALGCLISSCTDPAACNYDSASTEDNGSCYYTGDSCIDSHSNTINDSISEDCTCQGDIIGCTDPEACNYSSFAEVDDGSCALIGNPCNDGLDNTVSDTVTPDCQCIGETIILTYGCTDETACNYNSEANTDNGECSYTGDSCDDNNFATPNETYQEDCSCYTNILLGCTDETACNYNPIATLDNGSCTYQGDSCNDNSVSTVNDVYTTDCVCVGVIQGCTDEISCNYSPSAIVDNGSCIYPGDFCNDGNPNTVLDSYNSDCQCIGVIEGCIVSDACNFNPDAELADDSCLFPGDSCGNGTGNYSQECACLYNLSGYIFIDANSNGELDSGEIRIANHKVTAANNGQQVFSNSSGYFIMTGLESGEELITADYQVVWEIYTTPQTQEYTLPENSFNLKYFGVTNTDQPDPSGQLTVHEFYDIPCNDVKNYQISYENTSPYSINGYLEFTVDDLMSYDSSSLGADSVINNKVYMSFSALQSYSTELDNMRLNTPTEEFFGDLIVQEINLYAEYEGAYLLLDTHYTDEGVTCAYDPNDITGIPHGYTEEHWVLEDTTMEYVIRFQNTGNAPATTVLVVDTLDEHMDFNSFQLRTYSHEVSASVNAEGVVSFLFENINLPDSTSNLEESQGSVSFEIDFVDDISIGTELNQTAYIYFDNNPPIITNTTWHTIHECGGEAEFSTSSFILCEGNSEEFTSTYEHLESYVWSINSDLYSTDSSFTAVFTEPGTYGITLTAENPLCSSTSSESMLVLENDTIEFTSIEGMYCIDTEVPFIASGSENNSYSWTINGSEIGWSALTNAIHLFEEPGDYTVHLMAETGFCSSSYTEVITISEIPSSEFSSSAAEVCAGESIEFSASDSSLSSYLWTINSDYSGMNEDFIQSFEEAGSYTVDLTTQIENCQSTQSLEIIVNAASTVTISQNGDLLTSSEGDSYQWFLNGEAIEGATNQEYSVTEDGTYTAEVTNGGLCTGISEGVMVVNISELEAETILLYPNPMTDRAFLEFEDASVRTIRLIDSSGKEVRVWNSVSTQKIEINRGELASGNYLISILSENDLRSIQLVIR